MSRHKDQNWNLPTENKTWEHVTVALLMDIRDELKDLNRHLRCTNFVAIPSILRGIRRKLPDPKKRAKGRK